MRRRIRILVLLGASASMGACAEALTDEPEKYQRLQDIYAPAPHRVPLGMG